MRGRVGTRFRWHLKCVTERERDTVSGRVRSVVDAADPVQVGSHDWRMALESRLDEARRDINCRVFSWKQGMESGQLKTI